MQPPAGPACQGAGKPCVGKRATPASREPEAHACLAGVERIRDDRSAQRRQTLNDLFRTVRQMQTRDFLVGAPPAGAQEGTLRGRRTCPAKARARAGAARAPVTRRLLVERRRGAAGALCLQGRQLLAHRAARRQGPGARRSASPASAMPAPACNDSGRTGARLKITGRHARRLACGAAGASGGRRVR